MKNLNIVIEETEELTIKELSLISGGSEFSDWTWEKIGAGLHHVYNVITNPNTPEHIW